MLNEDYPEFNEINARFDAYINNRKFEEMAPNWWDDPRPSYWCVSKKYPQQVHDRHYAPSYTHSRDVLKSVRLKTWSVAIGISPSGSAGVIMRRNYCTGAPVIASYDIEKYGESGTPNLNEEFAEFHALVQAYIYEEQLKLARVNILV